MHALLGCTAVEALRQTCGVCMQLFGYGVLGVGNDGALFPVMRRSHQQQRMGVGTWCASQAGGTCVCGWAIGLQVG